MKPRKKCLSEDVYRLWVFFCFLVVLLRPLQAEKLIHSGANIKPTATRGMVIDAGSGGSRLHVFQWKPRIFSSVPPPLSYPEANEHWTARMDPGIHTFADNLDGLEQHLAPLIDFAKVTLVGSEEEFADYPIYFKATGGMRELPVEKREAIIERVQKYLSDKSFCPFFFKDDFARVISGEEEAIFSWTAVNFLKSTLIPDSHGYGEVKGVNRTYGTLDLGGASTQIAFYLPSQDILEGLFKLQIGGQKEWNVYTKSFLQFGVTSARFRHLHNMAETYVKANNPSPSVVFPVETPCLHAGYAEVLTSDEANPITSPALASYSLSNIMMRGPNTAPVNQFQTCKTILRGLMEKSQGAFCREVYHGDCSIAGAYQPPIPHTNGSVAAGTRGSFVGTSTYKYAWTFLQLPETATMERLEAQAASICQYNYADLLSYYSSHNLNNDNDKMTDIIPYSCFIATYIAVLLQDGYGFHRDDTLTVIDQINGNKVGWALGAILYEINELPWVLQLSTLESHPYSFVLLAAVAGFFLGVVAAVFVYREVLADKFHYTSEVNYQYANSTSAKAHYLYHRYHQLSMDEGDDDDDEEQAEGGHPRRERERSHSSSFFNSFFGFPDESPVPPRSSKHGGATNHKPTLSRNANSATGHSASNLMSYYNNYYNKKYHISTPPSSVGDPSEKIGNSLTGTVSGMQSSQSLNSPINKTPFYNVTLVKEVPLDMSSDSNKADHEEYEAHKPSNLHININYQTPPPAGPPLESTNTTLSPESNASPLLQQNAHGRPLSQVGSSQFNHSYSVFTPVARGQGWLDWVDLKPNTRPMNNIASPPTSLGVGGGNTYTSYHSTAGSSENLSMAEGMLATNSSDSSHPPSVKVKDRGKHRQQQKK